jgi:hypothetical protein
MPDRPAVPPNDELALTALRFAAGELSSAESEAFAERMAHDQDARDALSDAIRLSAAALGQPAPAPDPLVRKAARDEVRPTVWGRMVRRRPYHGHPAAWAGLGGTATACLAGFGIWLGTSPVNPIPVPRLGGNPAENNVAVNPPKRPAKEPVAVTMETAPVPVPVDGNETPPTAVATQPPPEPERMIPPPNTGPKANEIRSVEP